MSDTLLVFFDYCYRFNEIERNNILNLDFAEYRTYDPTIARWLQVDPMAEWAPELTPYRFGFNNPIRYDDPYGLFEDKDAAKAYAKANDIKTGWFSGNRIREQEDGTFAIENKKSGSVTLEFTDDEGETSVITGGTVSEDALHLAAIGMDAAVEIAERNPNAVLRNDWLDVAYYWGKALSFAAPTARLPTVAKAPTVGAKRNFKGMSFRGGKKSQRDPYLAKFAKKFRRWFHRQWKEPGGPNAPKDDIDEAFEAWKKAGEPDGD